jgi:hypothetical protein
LAEKIFVTYRRPKAYVPPYNYCDRWCERCGIDKSRCLLYQTEMDEHLHREIDRGKEARPRSLDRDEGILSRALFMVEEQARVMGQESPHAPAPEALRAPAGRAEDPIVEEGRLLARGIAAFVRAHAKGHDRDVPALRRYLALLAPKLGRASAPAQDEHEAADGILQAQVAHRALVALAAHLEKMRRREPDLGDPMLELFALQKRLRIEIEDRWLSKPSELLEPAPEGQWWGPLRDITQTLRHFRR